MGTYRLLKRIAVGGMAEVFLGKVIGASGFEKPVAVKRILPGYGMDPRFVSLLQREARLVVALQHANVVQVHDLGSSRGEHYMVMEYVDGETLRALMRSARAYNVPMGLRECCWIVQQVAEGLAYAHEQTDLSGNPLNIIHRDVNPANVLVSRSGEVKLADFGIAKAADGQQATQAGVIKGKANYLSPEQVRGLRIDQRSDIFLLGLLLHELLSGQQLFRGPSTSAIREIAHFDEGRLEPLPGVPPPLWLLVRRALAVRPQDRFQRARDFANALRSFLFDHRLKVGPAEIADLFSRAFPERRSPLEEVEELSGEELQLDQSEPITDSSLEMDAMLAPTLPADRRFPEALRPTPQEPPPRAPQAVPGAGARPTEAPRPAPAAAPALPPVRSSPRDAEAPGPAAAPAPGAAAAEATARRTRHRLGELLRLRGLISQEVLDAALARHQREGLRLGEYLVRAGLLSEQSLIRALSEHTGLPFIGEEKLRSMPVAPQALQLVPAEVAERLCVVPLSLVGLDLYCGMVDPRDAEVRRALKALLGDKEVRGVFASEPSIREAIRRLYLRQGDPLLSSRRSPEHERRHAEVMAFAERFMGGERMLEMDPGSGAEFEPSGLLEPSAEQPYLELLQGEEESPGPTHPQRPVPGREALPRLVVPLWRMLEGACRLLGGTALYGSTLARLARRMAERLGASALECEQAAAAGYALALAAPAEGRGQLSLPSASALKALLGSDLAGLGEVLLPVLQEATAGRAALALQVALTFLLETRSAQPSAAETARALERLRQEARVPSAVLEALAAEVGPRLTSTG